jgi:hypothetical protein
MVNKELNPLDPEILQAAGVSLDDALWITSVPNNCKVAALTLSRGVSILDQLRNYFGRQITHAPGFPGHQ